MEYEQQPMPQSPSAVQCGQPPKQYGQNPEYGQPAGGIQYGQQVTAQYGPLPPYNGQQVQYGQQGQFQYGQPGQFQYGQPGQFQHSQPGQFQYAQPGPVQYSQPGHVQYSQPGQVQYVIVNQPVVEFNYSIPRGMYPGVFMLLAALVNLSGIIVMTLKYGKYELFHTIGMGVGVLWYFIVGLLAVLGAAREKRNTQCLAVGIIVTGTLGLPVPTYQIVVGGFGLWDIQMLVKYGLSAHVVWSQPISIILICIVITACLSFIMCIMLIVFASQVACRSCCRPAGQPSGSAHYQAPQQPGQSSPYHQAPQPSGSLYPALQPDQSPAVLQPGAPPAEKIAPDEPSTMP